MINGLEGDLVQLEKNAKKASEKYTEAKGYLDKLD